MKNSVLLLCIFIAGVSLFNTLTAQVPVRDEDRFWAKRVVMRLDLREKINRPLVHHASSYYGADKYVEKKGMVSSLIHGLQRKEYLAYHPYDWNHIMDYDALLRRMEEFEQALQGDGESLDEVPLASNGLDEFGISENDWGEFEDEHFEEKMPERTEVMSAIPDLSNYEESIHIVEDWIFNKARGSMQQNIDFFEVIWTDPSGMLPEKVLARFRWEDVKEILGRTEWNNRFNDAETRSIKEVMEIRLFRGYMISFGGVPIKSLPQAEKRKLEMIEFEHHLWSY